MLWPWFPAQLYHNYCKVFSGQFRAGMCLFTGKILPAAGALHLLTWWEQHGGGRDWSPRCEPRALQGGSLHIPCPWVFCIFPAEAASCPCSACAASPAANHGNWLPRWPGPPLPSPALSAVRHVHVMSPWSSTGDICDLTGWLKGDSEHPCMGCWGEHLDKLGRRSARCRGSKHRAAAQLGVGPQGVRVTRECEAGQVRGVPKATVAGDSGQAASPGCCQGVVPHHCLGRAPAARAAAMSWPCPLVFTLLGQVWS